ncbi:MAG: hypothetical protein IT357_07575 [Gemmatimonadaceae bacterium]|nr:hypothetical protein [Gemmatimonadaceae bacterium]
MPYNLDSPGRIGSPCRLDALEGWFASEASGLPDGAERRVLLDVAEALDSFVRFPKRALLLWRGCDRVAVPPAKMRYHQYPDALKRAAKEAQVYLDGRPNGPAIAAFVFAGGDRPSRYGSSNAWSVHHLYSGKFPYPGRSNTTHAAKHGDHFTQSAGLVAVHPVADALVDEFPPFTWLLRAHAYRMFGYDPDAVFSSPQVLGFEPERQPEILFASS